MKSIIFQLSCLFLISVLGSSCSTSRFAKARAALDADAAMLAAGESSGDDEASVIAQASRVDAPPAQSIAASEKPADTPPLAEKSGPKIESTAPRPAAVVKTGPAIVKTGPAIEEIKKSVAMKTVTAPAVVASSPTVAEKAKALEVEKQDLVKTTDEDFKPSPYFTLFTKTEEEAANEPAEESAESSSTAE